MFRKEQKTDNSDESNEMRCSVSVSRNSSDTSLFENLSRPSYVESPLLLSQVWIVVVMREEYSDLIRHL